jgi:hypothetical protein
MVFADGCGNIPSLYTRIFQIEVITRWRPVDFRFNALISADYAGSDPAPDTAKSRPAHDQLALP